MIRSTTISFVGRTLLYGMKIYLMSFLSFIRDFSAGMRCVMKSGTCKENRPGNRTWINLQSRKWQHLYQKLVYSFRYSKHK